MPKENIERAIKRGTGELEGEKLEAFAFEALGPSGIAIIIEGITDNKNRTLGDMKQILNQYNGKLANEGSIKWMFDRKGVVIISNSQLPISKDETELFMIEAGADDIKWHNEFLEIIMKPEELDKVKKNLEEKKFIIESASLDWVAKEEIEITNKESLEKLFEALDDNDAVHNIYSNLKL
jgi:YebC/PmpR family DNA-binding regulatory protein